MLLKRHSKTVSYDSWKTTDTQGEQSWKDDYEREWCESLIRKDFPSLEDEAVIILAQERLKDHYYSNLDF